MIDKLRTLNNLNNILHRIQDCGLPQEVVRREIYDHSGEYQWVICGECFPKDEYVIIKNENTNEYVAYYSMDRDAALRANRINDALGSGFTATVHREYDNTATVFLENFVENEGFRIDFTRLITEGYQAKPEASFSAQELERMCNLDMYGYGTTTGYSYTYTAPQVPIRNNVNGNVLHTSGGEIIINGDGVTFKDNGGSWNRIATAADMLSVYGNPLVNEILNYANTPSDDPIERLVRGRILEIFNNATHLGGGR